MSATKKKTVTRVIGSLVGSSETRIAEMDQKIAEESAKNTRTLQMRYGISNEQIALLQRALAIYTDMIGDAITAANLPEELVQHNCQIAVERARAERQSK